MRFLLIALIALALVPGVNAVWEADGSVNASLPDIGTYSSPCYFLQDGTQYLISGNETGVFIGFNKTTGVWQSDLNIVSGLPDVGSFSSPACFFGGGTLYLISGNLQGFYPSFNRSTGTWQVDNNINASLPILSTSSKPTIFYYEGTRFLFSNRGGTLPAFNWTDGVGPWQADYGINASLPDTGDTAYPNFFIKDGTLYALIGDRLNEFLGFNRSTGVWQSDLNIESGLPGSLTRPDPMVYMYNTTLELIYGQFNGLFTGFKWNESTTPTVTIHEPNNNITANSWFALNATSTDSDVSFYWFNNSDFIISSDTPINDTGLVGAWNLGEGNGNSWISNSNITDYSGNGNDGEIFGAEYVQGRFEKGMDFDGIYSHINLPDSAGLNLTDNDITISGWIYPRELGRRQAIISKMPGSATTGYMITIESNNKLRFFLGNGSLGSVSSVDTIQKDVWTRFDVTYTGTTMRIFLNGSLNIASLAGLKGNIKSNTNTPVIGDWPASGGTEWNGTLDEIRIYDNRTLFTSEIEDEYKLANGYYNWTSISDNETVYTMTCQASDSYTNSSAASNTLRVGTAPQVEYIFETPVNNSIVSNDWFVVNVSSDDVITEGIIDLDGTNSSLSCVTINTTFSYCFKNNTGITDGNHTYTVFMNNTADILNQTGNRTVIINAIAPAVTIISPENITYNDTNVFLLANSTAVDEDSFFYWINVDGSNITNNISYVENTNISIRDFLGIARTYTLFVWVNDTGNNANQTSVTFTVNTTNQTNITIEPTTPPSGGGGGYSVDLNFTTNLTAATTVEGYEPFTVRANLFVNSASITFDTPVIRFSVNNIVMGSFNLHYVRGSNNNVTYERTVTLPPASYSYFIEVEGSNGVTYFSTDHFINVRVRPDENVSGVTLPSNAFFGLLVTFTDETTPKSHSRVTRTDGIYVSGNALNVNGSVSNVTLFILNEEGTSVLSTTSLDSADSGNNTWALFGFSGLPENNTRVSIMLGVTDAGGRSAYSVSRKILILSENEEGIIKDSLFPFLNPFGDDGEGDGISNGRIFASILILVVLVGGLYASGAGTIPAAAFAILVSVEFATFGMIPTWISILGMVLLGMVMMKSVLAMWVRR